MRFENGLIEPQAQRPAIVRLYHRQQRPAVLSHSKRVFSPLDRFDKRFIGLTGSESAIEAAQQASAVPPARKAAFNNRDYQVAHGSFLLAYTKDNLAHVIYPGGVTQKDWTQDLPRLVKETWSSR